MARPKRIIICPGCGEEKPYKAKGLCKSCYQHYWYLERREECRTRYRRYYEEHCEEVIARSRRWRQANPDCRRRWRQATAAYKRRWGQENPGGLAVIQARREAHKRNSPDTLTGEEAEHLMAIGQAMYPGEKLQLDHIVPLSRGGGTTLANMHAIPISVNCSKREKLPQEVYKQVVLI